MERSASASTSSNIANAGTETYRRLYAKRFLNRLDPVLRAARGRWYCDPTILTRAEFERAIVGTASLGLYAVSPKGKSKWACIDVDDPDRFSALMRLLEGTSNHDHMLLELSRRGFHLWAFFDPPVPWSHARAYGLALADKYLTLVEVFPKGPGLNGVRAPGSRHPKDGRVYPFLNKETWVAEEDFQGCIERIKPITLEVVPEVRERARAVPGLSNVQETHSASDHLDLLSEVTRYTPMKHLGGERYLGRCPFHADRHPSFGIDGEWWECFTKCQGPGRSRGGLNAFKARMRERGL